MTEAFRLVGKILVDGDQATQALGEVDKKASDTGSSLGKIIGGAAKVGAAVVGAATVAAGAMMKIATKTADAGDRVDKLSQQLGMSRDGFQEWEYVMSQAGMSIDSMGRAMRMMADLTVKETDKSSEALEKLGLSFAEVEGLSQEDAFELIVGRFQEMEEGAEKASLANELFGRSGREMIPLLNSAAGSVDELKQEAHDLGMVMDDNAIDSAVELTDTIDTMKRAVSGLMNTLGKALMPILNSVIQIIIDNMPLIQGMFERLAPVLAMAFEQLLPPLVKLGEKLLPVFFGLIEKILPIIAALAEAVMPVFIAVLDAIIPVVEPLLELFLDFINVVLIPIIGHFAKLMEGILPVVVSAFEMFMPVLMPLMEAFMEIVDLILPDLIELFMLLVEEAIPIIEEILPMMIELFTLLMPVILLLTQGLMEVIKHVLPPLIRLLRNMTERTLPYFGKGFERLQPIIEGVMNFIRAIIGAVLSIIQGDWAGAWGFIQKALEIAAKGLEGLLTGLKNVVVNIGKGLLEYFKAMPGIIMDNFKDLPSRMMKIGKSIIEGLWKGIKGMGKSLVKNLTKFAKEVIPGPIAKALGIRSPSKLFEGFGENISEGLALGIEETKGLVERASLHLGQSVLEPQPVGATENYYHSNRTIEVPVVINGKELARITARDFDNELEKMRRA